jgi:type VI secretion system protein ImpL
MKRFFSWFLQRWVLSLLGVLLFSLLIWFEAPLLAFNGKEPFASETVRWAFILAALFLWAAYFAWKAIAARLAARKLMAGIAGENQPPPAAGARESAAEVAALTARMQDAMKVLRKASAGGQKGSQSMTQLPWYLFVGAPGSGKTTALVKSGLKFPLAESLGQSAIGGVGGTRNCDWWFTDEAVLLDTAGRYTTQDSYTEVDRAAWRGFLQLLKKHRRRRPVNGVIVALSVADLLQQNEAGRRAQALAIRERIKELHEQLGIRFPIYVVVTKCDLLAGFVEFFDTLGREERAQVWGLTFAAADAGKTDAALAGFPAEFDALERQLQVRVLARVQQERDLQRRALLYSFPQQFAGIGEVLGRFLTDVFESTRYEERALLRGVYFTSGTQEGSPIDRVMSAMADAFGLDRRMLPANANSGRSYFITRLLRDVIFREAELAGTNLAFERKRRLLQWSAMGAIACLVLLLSAGLFTSYLRNKHYVAEVAARAAEVDKLAKATPARGSVVELLPLLNAVRSIPAGYADRDADVPLLNRFGLYQGDKLGAGSQLVYHRFLREALLPRLAQRLEDVLRRGDANNQEYLYEALRVYLMLGDRKHFDAESVQAWLDVDWSRNLPEANEAQRRDLSNHLGALLADANSTAAPLALDTALVAQVRLRLAQMPLPEQIYNRLKRQVALARLPEFSATGAVGRDVSQIFVRQSGQPLTRGISGTFTLAGYRKLLSEIDQAIADIARDSWVLDRQESAAATGNNAQMKAAVLQLYYADYIKQWDALLADVRIVPFTSLDQGARITTALSAADSPMRKFMQAATRETTLEAASGGSALAATANALVRGKLDAAKKKLESALGGVEVAPAAATPSNPVDEHFDSLHRMTGAPPAPAVPGAPAAPPAAAPIDQVLAMLKDVALYMDAADAARRGGLPPPAGDALVRLKREADGKPPLVAGMLKSIEASGGGLTLGSERARLNALWAASGAPFCKEAIAGRYPMQRNAAKDITLDDFGRFFAPGGTIDDFFAKNLAPLVDMSGKQWRWRAVSDAPLGISQETLNEFQRAARVRDMFFAAGGRQPSLRFELKPVSGDPQLTTVVLDIDGQPVSYEPGTPVRATPVLLPSGKSGGQVHIEATPPGRAELRTDGPWAWFRMIDKGSLDPSSQGERYKLTFDLDGRKMVYELTASSVVNPFRRDALEQFRCPDKL